jgi:hypothetical protein
MKTLEKTRVESMNVTINVPDQLGKKINSLPQHVIVNIFEEYIQSNSNEDKEELEFDKAVIEALESDEMQDITRKFAEHSKVRKIHNPITI